MRDFASIIEGQRRYFQSGATRPLEFRRRQLQRLREGIERLEQRLTASLQADLHKSPFQAFSSEIGLVIADLDYAARHLAQWMRPQPRRVPMILWPARGLLRPEPLGIALILALWNYPLQLSLMPLIGAIAAGCCAIVKTSEYAPASSAAISELVRDVFDEQYVAAVEGDRQTGEAYLVHRFDVIFFTGGCVAGRAVMSAAARHLTPVVLELGGKSPCIVCVNDTMTHIIGASLPFGGLGESGIGSYHGKASFDCFTHYRSVLKRSLSVNPKLRYPPRPTTLPTLKRLYRFLLRR